MPLLDSNFIDAVIYHNNIDMVGAYTTVIYTTFDQVSVQVENHH